MAKRKNEPEIARIESSAHDGRGIAAVAGKKVFVSGALEGETVRFMRRKRRRNYDEAELLEVLEASDSRIEPKCAAFGNCGGCSLQHLSSEDQRTMKQQTLHDNLQRIGHVLPETWLPPLYNEEDDGSFYYRRRGRLAVKDVAAKGKVLVGFREKHAPYVADMARCEVLAKPLDSLIEPLSDLVGKLSIRARLPQIELAVADNAIAMVFRVLDPPTDADKQHLSEFGKAHDLRIMLQTGGLDTVAALDEKDLEPLHYVLSDYNITIEFSGTDFIQVNGAVNQRMVAQAIELLQVESDHRVLDLYCGIGNFSLPLATKAAHVLGIEGENQQVERAAANARLNGITNCEFRTADLSKIDGKEPWMKQSWDRVLLDPARSGATDVVHFIDKLGPERIVYVSCHPGTLARDTGELVEKHGYQLEAAGIIDMFPHTGHVESIAVFRKTGKK